MKTLKFYYFYFAFAWKFSISLLCIFVAIIFYQKRYGIAIDRHYVKRLKFNNFLFESIVSNKNFSINWKVKYIKIIKTIIDLNRNEIFNKKIEVNCKNYKKLIFVRILFLNELWYRGKWGKKRQKPEI